MGELFFNDVVSRRKGGYVLSRGIHIDRIAKISGKVIIYGCAKCIGLSKKVGPVIRGSRDDFIIIAEALDIVDYLVAFRDNVVHIGPHALDLGSVYIVVLNSICRLPAIELRCTYQVGNDADGTALDI